MNSESYVQVWAMNHASWLRFILFVICTNILGINSCICIQLYIQYINIAFVNTFLIRQPAVATWKVYQKCCSGALKFSFFGSESVLLHSTVERYELTVFPLRLVHSSGRTSEELAGVCHWRHFLKLPNFTVCCVLTAVLDVQFNWTAFPVKLDSQKFWTF